MTTMKRTNFTIATTNAWERMLSQSFDPREWFDDGRPPNSPEPQGGGTEKVWVYCEVEGEGGEGVRYEVGFFDPQGEWHHDSWHAAREEAAKRVRFLNGGS